MALISLRMLLESPNPKDPQDAEVAKMLMDDPESFAQKAHDWAVKFAGAPRRDMPFSSYEKEKKPEVQRDDPNRYELEVRTLCLHHSLYSPTCLMNPCTLPKKYS